MSSDESNLSSRAAFGLRQPTHDHLHGDDADCEFAIRYMPTHRDVYHDFSDSEVIPEELRRFCSPQLRYFSPEREELQHLRVGGRRKADSLDEMSRHQLRTLCEHLQSRLSVSEAHGQALKTEIVNEREKHKASVETLARESEHKDVGLAALEWELIQERGKVEALEEELAHRRRTEKALMEELDQFSLDRKEDTRPTNHREQAENAILMKQPVTKRSQFEANYGYGNVQPGAVDVELTDGDSGIRSEGMEVIQSTDVEDRTSEDTSAYFDRKQCLSRIRGLERKCPNNVQGELDKEQRDR